MLRNLTKMAGRRLSKKKVKLILSGFALVLILCGWLLAQEFAWYCHPYGPINYRGEPPPDGIRVVAVIQGTEFDTCFTQNGQYDLTIPKDDPVSSHKEGWADGDTITIRVGGFDTMPKFPAFSGSQKIDLYLPSLDVKLTTWGKIKALFK
jgi:hypothetical protein